GPPFYRVVGVVGDIHDDGLDKLPLRAVFFPILPIRGAELWEPPTAESYLLRTSANDPTLLVGAARRVIAEADPGVALANPRTMNQVVAKSIARVSFTMLLLGAAAFMAVVLSAVGIYGVIAYVVGQRRTEIGIRMALGAGSGEVVTLVAMQSVRLASLGVVIGLAGALLATRALRSLLFEVSPTDPVTLGTVSVALIAVAAIAGWLPARRAARISPLEAIR
ncbi:MAG TPA: FtsX-like permease family protein, partial [Gemmatimonadaceae bacterium]|nr:FtsX-like permease family protein [Gemmatimonadaceae bacterium]